MPITHTISRIYFVIPLLLHVEYVFKQDVARYVVLRIHPLIHLCQICIYICISTLITRKCLMTQHVNFTKISLVIYYMIDWFIDWCLMPTLAVLQLYCGVVIYYIGIYFNYFIHCTFYASISIGELKLEAQWAEPVSLTFHSALRKLNTEPSIVASHQISVHFAMQFQRRRLFRNWPTRNKNCLWQPCLLTDRDKISNIYRVPSIYVSYKVSIHLTKQFQRRRFLEIDQSETSTAYGGHVCLRIKTKWAIYIEDIP